MGPSHQKIKKNDLTHTGTVLSYALSLKIKFLYTKNKS